MTDNSKIMFENETLKNASPATVSRAGIIYVSAEDLDWWPYAQAWVAQRPQDQHEGFTKLFTHYIGECAGQEPGHLFSHIARNIKEVMPVDRVGKVTALCRMLTGLLADAVLEDTIVDMEMQLEKAFLYCLAWTVGGCFETVERKAFDTYLRSLQPAFDENASDNLPTLEEENESMYEYYIDPESMSWEKWAPEQWTYPDTEVLDFSNLLVPTMDSTRAINVIDLMQKQALPILLVGGPGTAKTSTVLMYNGQVNAAQYMFRRFNFSSATQPLSFQVFVEAGLDKRGGKTFGPPGGKKAIIFMDDLSMPIINEWGDQPTVEIVRQIVEEGGIMFLEKDKRGDRKICDGLQYIAAMGHPGGGKNDIPMRLKRHFLCMK